MITQKVGSAKNTENTLNGKVVGDHIRLESEQDMSLRNVSYRERALPNPFE